MRLPQYIALPLLAASTLLARGLAGQGPPAPPAVSVGGLAYLQYGYQVSDTSNHGNNFDVTRAYLNFLGRFSDGLATRITADAYHNATDGSLTYRIKYAYAAYTPKGSDLTFELGVIHTTWLDWEEALWDYRMQGTMAYERNGYGASADFGAGVDGHWNNEQLNAQVAVINGENYNKPLGDQRKDIQARVSVRVATSDDGSRVGGIRLTAYAQYGKPTGGGTRRRLLGMASYKSKVLTLAAEGLLTQDSTTGGALAKGQVISGYGVYRFPKSGAALLARVDYAKPNTDGVSTAPGFSNTRIIGGVSYQLTPNLRLLGDVDLLSYANGTPTAALEATRRQALFQAQFTF
jgi:hypothetical protein